MVNAHTTLASLFSDIAKAIRGKTGNPDTIVADTFPTAITSISTLSSDTSDATATESDIVYKKTAYVNGVKVTGGVSERTANNSYGADGTSISSDDTYINLTGTMDVDMLMRSGSKIELSCLKSWFAKQIGLTSSKIARGSSVLGIAGSAEAGRTAVDVDIAISSVNGSTSTSSYSIAPGELVSAEFAVYIDDKDISNTAFENTDKNLIVHIDSSLGSTQNLTFYGASIFNYGQTTKTISANGELYGGYWL